MDRFPVLQTTDERRIEEKRRQDAPSVVRLERTSSRVRTTDDVGVVSPD